MVEPSRRPSLMPFGKEVRKLRIDLGLRLKGMATDLGCSSAHLSAVETGKKPVPSTLNDRIVETYALKDDVAEKLRQAEYRSKDTFKLTATTPLSRDVAAQLSRTFHKLSEDDFRAIQLVLANG